MKAKELAQSWLRVHEGYKAKPYLCSKGKVTIGYGHNCEASDTPVLLIRGEISKPDAEKLFVEDTANAIKDAGRYFVGFDELTTTRKAVLIDMSFNLGLKKLRGFTGFLKALNDCDYNRAAFEMLDSLWAVQVGDRATFLARKMKDGY